MLKVTEELIGNPEVIETVWRQSISTIVELDYNGEDVNFTVDIYYDSIGDSAVDTDDFLTHFRVDSGDRIGDGEGEGYDRWEDLNDTVGDCIDKKFPNATKEERDALCEKVFELVQNTVDENEIMY